jgi:subtilisin
MYSRTITRELPLKLVTVLALVLFLGGVANAQLFTPAQQGGNPNDYLVAFRPGTSQAQRAAATQGAGAMIRFNYQLVDGVAVRIPNPNALAALQRNPSVLSIIPDRAVHAFQSIEGKGKPGGGSGTPAQVVPAGVTRVGPPTTASNGAGVGVAIVDTGIDFNHADLSVAAESYAAPGGSCQDDQGHGTHVAGIVAAKDNSIDVVGVAPAAKLYCVKVLDASGSGSDGDIIAGLDWIKQNAANVTPPIRVVNMSLGRAGSVGDNLLLRQAVQALYNVNIVVVVAAGNDQTKEVSQMVPATYPEVLAVASTTALAGSNSCRFLAKGIPADTASYFTTDGFFVNGMGVTISAPGEDQENVNSGCFISSVGILSTKLGGGTIRMSGTSMASPHVAGVVARTVQVYGTDTVENIRSRVRGATNADKFGTAPLDSPASGYTFDQEHEGIVKAK